MCLQTFSSQDASTCFYRVEYLGLPPRSFTRLTLGGSPAPSDVAAVLQSTVRIAIVPEKKVRPLVFLLPNESWGVEVLRARCGASNCVNLPDGYGIDFRSPSFGGDSRQPLLFCSCLFMFLIAADHGAERRL